jgi:hypothetical protein
VYPSGAARARRSVPIWPAAPATFSTTIGRPRLCDIFCAMARATLSTAVPACSGTSIVIGRDG